MPCCEVTYQTFTNQSVTTIPWTATDKPIVQVAYQQEDGTYNFSFFTNIKRTPTQIIIDHGGPATGVVKILN